MTLRSLLIPFAAAGALALPAAASAAPVTYDAVITGTVDYQLSEQWFDGGDHFATTSAGFSFETSLGQVTFDDAGNATPSARETTISSPLFQLSYSSPTGSGACSGSILAESAAGDLAGTAGDLKVRGLKRAFLGGECDGELAGRTLGVDLDTNKPVGDGLFDDRVSIPASELGNAFISRPLGRETGPGADCPLWTPDAATGCTVSWNGELRLTRVGGDGGTGGGGGNGGGTGGGNGGLGGVLTPGGKVGTGQPVIKLRGGGPLKVVKAADVTKTATGPAKTTATKKKAACKRKPKKACAKKRRSARRTARA